MPKFEFTGLDSQAVEHSGMIEAADEKTALEELRKQAFYPVSIERASQDRAVSLPHLGSRQAQLQAGNPRHTLGKCPTCNGLISLSAVSCPHCGEIDFFEEREVSGACPTCKGTGQVRKLLKIAKCPDCQSGHRVTIVKIDLRSR
ncbi:MAG: hypothetical protein P1U89_10910 [Verrucomicrobiales bacterium]|nr:hypothetical protein [Verrucomicrobiales bacterium]